MSTVRIGYERLNPEEKRVYDRFAAAFASCSATIDGGGVDRGVDVMKVLQTALGDDPRVIYFNKSRIAVSASLLTGKRFHLTGACSPAQNQTMIRDLDRAVDRAVEEIRLLNPMTDYDRIMCIYEYLQDHVVYDEEELRHCCQYGKGKNPHSHNAYGALVEGKAVCDGISGAFCLLAQTMGYPCMVVSGRAAFRTQGLSEHAWNLIRVGTKHYHLDATWDINHKSRTGDYAYQYFCVDDDDINADHDWDINSTPACGSQELSYYRRSRCYANNLSQLEEIFRRFARSKQDVVRVKIAHGIPIPGPADGFLGQKLADAAAGVGRHAAVRYSYDEGTRCFYGKFIR